MYRRRVAPGPSAPGIPPPEDNCRPGRRAARSAGRGRLNRCQEIGANRGSVARRRCEHVAPKGHVTATDIETGLQSELARPNLTVLRHDVRTDDAGAVTEPPPHPGSCHRA